MNIQYATFPQITQEALKTIPVDRHFLLLAVMCPEELSYTFAINKGETVMNISYQPQPAPAPTQVSTQ